MVPNRIGMATTSLYVYGRGHGSCIAPVTAAANAGFAFHEGWGDLS